MKLPHLRRPTPAPEDRAATVPAPGSSLGLDDWHGSWPVDDTPSEEGPGAEVPLLLNPGSPNIAPS
jgi:hypothetical protein